jgi:hypothetical protein
MASQRDQGDRSPPVSGILCSVQPTPSAWLSFARRTFMCVVRGFEVHESRRRCMVSWNVIAFPLAALPVLYIIGIRSFRKVRKTFRDEMSRKRCGAMVSRRPNWIVGGMMGSGKTTFARSVAESFGARHIEIDLYASEEAILKDIDSAASTGWVAEANPWQIPPSVVERAAVIIFLDYDNVVNYLRLLVRGYGRWRSRRLSWSGFKQHIVDEIILDLWRIVYRHGKTNRKGWREIGLFKGMDVSSAVSLRCVSPAELQLLQDCMTSKKWDETSMRAN